MCEPNCNGNRRDKVALRTTCIKNVKFKIIKTRTGCQYVGYFYYSENLNWAAQNPRLGCMRATGHGLDIADLNKLVTVNYTRNMAKFCLYQEKNEHTKRFQKIPNSRFLLCAVNTPVGNTGVEWDANFCWGQQRLIHNTLRHFVLQNCADVCWHQQEFYLRRR